MSLPLVDYSSSLGKFFCSAKLHPSWEKDGSYYVTDNPSTVPPANLAPWTTERLLNGKVSRAPLPISTIKEIPSNLLYPPHCVLDDYQYESLSYILSGDDTLLGDDAGLGKTVIMTCALNAWKASSILIVCPSVVKYNWKRELSKWLLAYKSLSTHVVEGDDIGEEDTDILIINYDLLTRHKKTLRDRKWDVIIYDESHRLKNPQAKRTKVAFGKGHLKATKRIFASATPLNRPKDLWTVTHSCAPNGLGKDWFRFHTRYCDATRTSFGWDVSGASNLSELGVKLRQQFYVRHDDSVLNLPPYVESIIALPTSSAMRQQNKSMLLTLINKAKEEDDTEALEKLSGLVASIKLNSPTVEITDAEIDNAICLMGESLSDLSRGLRFIVPAFESISAYRRIVSEEKAASCIEYARTLLGKDGECYGEPVLFFAHHKPLIAALEEALTHDGYKVEVITGDVSAKKRDEIKERFQKGDTQVIIANLFAGGEGITLTAANRCVFFEVDWNATTMRQCLKRIHRRTQTRPCRIDYVLVDNTVEIYVASSFIGKRAIINEVNNEVESGQCLSSS